jgi:hypothetical protein
MLKLGRSGIKEMQVHAGLRTVAATRQHTAFRPLKDKAIKTKTSPTRQAMYV